jgi:hypothetical protein
MPRQGKQALLVPFAPRAAPSKSKVSAAPFASYSIFLDTDKTPSSTEVKD